jgi:GxxExxY protein
VCLYYADLIEANKVIIEVRSVDTLDDPHRAHVLNYLRISGVRAGMFMNFARPTFAYERLVI